MFFFFLTAVPASMHAFPSVTALEGTHPVLVCSVMTSSVPTFQLFSSRGALISAIDADYSLSMAGPSNEFVYTVNVTFLRPVTREDMGTFNCVVDGTPLLSTSTLTVIGKKSIYCSHLQSKVHLLGPCWYYSNDFWNTLLGLRLKIAGGRRETLSNDKILSVNYF